MQNMVQRLVRNIHRNSWVLITIFAISVVLLLTSACDENSFCITGYHLPEDSLAGYKLDGHVISVTESTANMPCYQRCTLDCRCVSYNEDIANHLCQLNSDSNFSVPHLLVQQSGFRYQNVRVHHNQKTCDTCNNLCCLGNPCQNNGQCEELCNHSQKKMNCTCVNGFTGSLCQFKDPCAGNPCGANGRCVNLVSKYNCTCRPNYFGDHCERKHSDILFPKGVVTDYAIARDYDLMQDLSEFTLSLWLQTNDTTRGAGYFSYATTTDSNTILLIDSAHGLKLNILNSIRETAITLRDGKWHHVAITWENTNGQWNIYSDGTVNASGSGFKTGLVVPRVGTIVLGQDQDLIGGGFHESQSYLGLLSEVNLWNRVLTSQEVADLSSSCHTSIQGCIFNWSESVTYHGEVKVVSPSSC